MTPRAQVEAEPRAGRPTAAQARRRCAATRTVRPRDDLIRFVIGPTGAVVPDTTGVLPGRGLWLSADRDVINTACAHNLFAKNFRVRAIIEGDLADRVEALLARRCLDLIGLAQRCGQLAAGGTKVRQALSAGRSALVIVASDASTEEWQRISRLAPEVPRVELFSSTELAAALGRGRVVYAAILNGGAKGGLAARIMVEAKRLQGLRSNQGSQPGLGSTSDGMSGTRLTDGAPTVRNDEPLES